MKKLSEILKIALNHIDAVGFTCMAVRSAYNLGEITEKEKDLTLFEIGEMVGHELGATIPLWLLYNHGVEIEDSIDFLSLRHMVIGAWIDKLESEGK